MKSSNAMETISEFMGLNEEGEVENKDVKTEDTKNSIIQKIECTCGKIFKVVIGKKGRPRTRCDDCISSKKKLKNVKKETNSLIKKIEEKKEQLISININFTGRESFYKMLKESAQEDIRTIEEQALFYIIRSLKENTINIKHSE